MKYFMALPFFPPEEIDWVLSEYRKILNGEGMLSMSVQVKAFENEFAKFVGTSHAVATNSCSAALEIALRSIGLKKGDEVIVPAETFIASGASVVREGGTPVFADVSEETFNLTVETIREKLTPRTRAIILVHMAGHVADDVTAIRTLCDQNGIVMIEDAAHAHGASVGGRQAGSFGHIGCFSFFPSKMMTTGEGGMLVTNDAAIGERASSYRSRGLDLSAKAEQYSRLGTNNRMTEFAALLGRSQLRTLPQFVADRNAAAKTYCERIKSSSIAKFVKLPEVPRGSVHAYWRFMVSLDPAINRETLRDLMKTDGISVDWAYYPPLHLQPVFVEMFGTKPGQLPRTEKILSQNLCLPMHVGIKTSDAEFIAERFIQHVSKILADRV